MIGILLITHGRLGQTLIECASHVLNRQATGVRELAVSPDDDPLAVLPRVRALVREIDEGQGVLVLSDMYGASPSNVASKLIVPGRVEGVTGVNLPMLIRVLSYRDRPLSTIVVKAVSGGCEGVARIPAPLVKNAAAGG